MIKSEKILDIERIEISFENSEWVTVPRKYLGNFILRDISGDLTLVANTVVERYVAKYLYLEIYKDYTDNHKCQFIEKDKSITERILESKDITEICIYYNDKSNRYVNCDWGIENEYVNSYQRNEIETLKNGRELINITIAANKDSKN